jgi:hypothetical protein
MVRLMHGECGSSELFMKYLIESSMRVQAALVDQLFNSSEKRLARIMLMMAEYGESGEPIEFIPTISQEMRAGMIGTTRSRVSFFINCFRNLGFIEYKDRIRVHKSLLNVILHDRPSERNAKAPPWFGHGTWHLRSELSDAVSLPHALQFHIDICFQRIDRDRFQNRRTNCSLTQLSETDQTVS